MLKIKQRKASTTWLGGYGKPAHVNAKGSRLMVFSPWQSIWQADRGKLKFRTAQRPRIATRNTPSFAVIFAFSCLLICECAANASPLTARDVTEQLFKSQQGARPDFTGQDLMRLDLAGLDFKQASLSQANVFGADLSQANLSGADLRGANLDRVTLIATRFENANLEGASLLRPSVFTSLAAPATEAPSFRGANMRNIKIFGRFTRANFQGADLTGATCAPFGKTGFIEEIWRTELSGANFTGALLSGANFTHALLTFADLRGADLHGTILKDADLTGADLSGANLTGADVTGADLSGVKLMDVKGFDQLRGFSEARNTNKVLR